MNTLPTRRTALALLAALLALRPALAADTSKIIETTPPLPVPDILFSDVAGKELTLADYRGQPLLLNIWATWCKPCVAEMPALNRLQELLPALRVLPISLDRGAPEQVREKVQSFYAQHQLSALPVLLDRELSIPRRLKPRGLPLTVLINTDGLEVARVLGELEWDTPSALASLRRLLNIV